MSRRHKQAAPGQLPSSQAYRNKGPWLTSQQAKYYAWLEALYEALLPWMEVIKNIQSDYS